MNKIIYSKEHNFLIERLREARIEAGFGQGEIAKRLGKTQSYISKIESGQRRIDVVELKEFANLYNKNLNYFIK